MNTVTQRIQHIEVRESDLEFERLMDKVTGLLHNQFVEFAYAAHCEHCDTWQPFCQNVELEKNGPQESWCLGCIGMARLRQVSWRQSLMPLLNAVAPNAPASPWGSNT